MITFPVSNEEVFGGRFKVEIQEKGSDCAGGLCAGFVRYEAENMPCTEDEVTARVYFYADPIW